MATGAPQRLPSDGPRRFFTIGHSNRTLEAFVELLSLHGIQILVDVRAFPHSRSHPQFDRATLSSALRARGLGYHHVPALGGRRPKRRECSPNAGWREEGFRNYADYMATQEFASGMAELLALAAVGQVAYMCSEAVPWRCHRRLISDCLVAKGHEVYDILSKGPARPHRFTPFAVVAGPCVTYPEAASDGC